MEGIVSDRGESEESSVQCGGDSVVLSSVVVPGSGGGNLDHFIVEEFGASRSLRSIDTSSKEVRVVDALDGDMKLEDFVETLFVWSE